MHRRLTCTNRIDHRGLTTAGLSSIAVENRRAGEAPRRCATTQMSSSILIPLYAAGSSGVSTRQGFRRPGIGTNRTAGRPCRRITIVSSLRRWELP